MFRPLALSCGSCLLVMVPLLGAQQPTFRASTTLIEFTAVAKDDKGNPVADLKQEDFTITENGKARDIAFFRFEGTPEPPRAVKPLPSGIFSNRPDYAPGPPRNIIAIVMDALNTQPADQLTVRAQVMRYLGTIAQDTRVAIYRSGERVQVVHDFTDDIESLRKRFSSNAVEAALHTGVGIQPAAPAIPDWQVEAHAQTPEIVELLKAANAEQARLEEQNNQQIQNSRSDNTLKALHALSNHLAAIPGRKSVVWITPGTPTVMVGASDPWLKNYESAIRATAHRMATQGITVYPVEATGIRPPDLKLGTVVRGASRGTPLSRAEAKAGTQSLTAMSTTSDQRRLPSAMDVLADVTGGRTLRNTNDLTSGMRAASDDLRGTYSIGFYVPQEPDSQWHPFKVHIGRSGVKLTHRQGYLGVVSRAPHDWQPDDWRGAANDPLGSSGIRLDAKLELTAGALSAVIVVAGEDLQFRQVNGVPTTDLDVAIAEKNTQGLVGVRYDPLAFQVQPGQLNDLSSLSIRFPKEWRVLASTSLIRLMVRDRLTGRYGTIDVPVAQLQR